MASNFNKLEYLKMYKPESVPVPITKAPTRVLRVRVGPKEAMLSAILLCTMSYKTQGWMDYLLWWIRKKEKSKGNSLTHKILSNIM